MAISRIKYTVSIVLALFSLAAIGCGDDSSGDEPFCRDGKCGDGGAGGGDGSDVCGGVCASGTTCNVTTKKCESSSVDACGNACGGNTHCDTATKKCVPNTGSDTCGGACGAGTVCQNGVCVPSGSGGSGGDSGSGGSGGTNFAGVTWKNSNSPSGNGWVDVSSGSDGDYILAKTAWFVQSETAATICFIGYGSNTLLTCNGACEWWNVSKSWLGAQVGKNPNDLSYMTSKQASIDTASRLLTYRATAKGSRPASAFYWRAAGSNSSWIDPEAVGSNQSAIHCAYVPSNGVVETN